MLDPDSCYQAMLARDPRFDGKFYVGVKTTGIYCRPVCPAKPKRENVEFFSRASHAEEAGYRPCLRCRPECSPDSPHWHGTSAVVARALKLIAASEFIDGDEERFAELMGVGARHLRRLFKDELGLTPKQIADTHRLNFARTLTVETSLPLTDVAAAAGFTSLRRFNDAFKKRFHRSPSTLRARRKETDNESEFEIRLPYRPPLEWDSLIRFFQRHAIPGVERSDDLSFERVYRLSGSIGAVRVERELDTPELKVRITTRDPKVLLEVTRRVRRMFDLDCDPVLVSNGFATSRILNLFCERFPGVRLPRGFDPFETAVCAILGQLVSTSHASLLIGQLVEAYGEPVLHPVSGEPVKLFPTPASLASSDLSEIKTTGSRRETIREFARRVRDGELSFSDAQDPADFKKSLLAIRGIGPWSAEYISLRAIGDTDAFPGTDLILKRALERHRDLDLESARPWRAYAAIHLWNDHLLSNPKEA